MSLFFFPRLARMGMRKNSRLYLPFIGSCTGMVMMFYIIVSICQSPLLPEMAGGGTLSFILSLGKFVIAAFALLFLFYTNSFLVRRRYHEFGLYNVLGMDKRSIGRIVLWESFFTALVSIALGIAAGILFSKLAELGLLNAIRREIDYTFRIPRKALLETIIMFSAIFLLLALNSLLQVRKSRPLELMRSESAGEKPPRSNTGIALIGLVLLAAAYYTSVSIKSPLAALVLFFIAVLVVIAATYLLFIAGSVSLCGHLKKNKKYYYRKEHFVSVSSMAFRMKRNGAGLASICILSTMVLVMLSSTASLFFGENDALLSRYPYDVEIKVNCADLDGIDRENCADLRQIIYGTFAEAQIEPEKVCEVRYASTAGLFKDNTLDPYAEETETVVDYGKLYSLYFMEYEDYARLSEGNVPTAPGPGQAYAASLRCDFSGNSISLPKVELTIAGEVSFPSYLGEATSLITPSILLIIPDFNTIRPLDEIQNSYGLPMLENLYFFGYDADLPEQELLGLYTIQTGLGQTIKDLIPSADISCRCRTSERDVFFTNFGALFFVGIILSAVFIFACAMIIYYKQVSEGYEDRKRFAVLQKVGMTKEDIRKSIRSQVRTVFFAPFLMAGLHLAFAFPLIWNILESFNLHNMLLVILITAAAFVSFGLVYTLIYKLTARAYYSIVLSGESE